MVCGNMLFAGQLDGGNFDGVATRPLFANVELAKQLVMLVIGTSRAAQLAWPPPALHTGYCPVTTRLLVKTNAYIGTFTYTFPVISMWVPESGNAVTWLMVTA